MRLLLISSLLAACGASTVAPRTADPARVERPVATAPTPAAPAACNPVLQICWTDSPRLRELAVYHRQIAAERRAASAALRAAEARSCAGLPDDDRDLSPFSHLEDIASVTPIEERSLGEVTVWYTAGATISFRPVPGLTVEGLQRVVDCQLARNAALRHERPELPNCPLVLAHVTARVQAVAEGFAIEVRSEDDATANAILERAERLRPLPETLAFGR